MITGGRVYPVRHYPIAIRLRDREGRAILCVALTPQSGDSSGATLGVRSVALLHARNHLQKRLTPYHPLFIISFSSELE
jgi:hypothetical protein